MTTSISPPDVLLVSEVESLRKSNPTLGAAKLLTRLREEHPEWAVSEKRLKRILQSLSNVDDPQGLVVATSIDNTLDVSSIATKVKVRMFAAGKGKGLVARDKLLQGEVIWQEDPWVTTADSNLSSYLFSQRACSQCFTIFNQPNPPMSVACPHCDMAHFCNRLCLSRARESVAHHELLCPGQNPLALELLTLIHQRGFRHLDAAVKIIAKWRGEREWGNDAQVVESRVWAGLARVDIEKKESERKEWELVGEPRQREWRSAYELVKAVLDPEPSHPNYKPFHKVLHKYAKRRLEPLSEQEQQRWFSFESFKQLWGLASINQEESGGLYILHSHLNHSCDPNVSCRNLPRTFVPPTTLPTELPGRNPPGVRGTNKLTLLARRTIHPGDELTISYVDTSAPRTQRRSELRENYGFWCVCPRCQKEKDTEDVVVAQEPASHAIGQSESNS